MTDFILIDSKTRAPVPLPFHTTLEGDPFTIDGFSEPDHRAPLGKVVMRLQKWPFCRYKDPSLFGLQIISEADFMAEQEEIR